MSCRLDQAGQYKEIEKLLPSLAPFASNTAGLQAALQAATAKLEALETGLLGPHHPGNVICSGL